MDKTVYNARTRAASTDNAGVRIPPPIPFTVVFLLGWLLQSRWPLPFLPTPVALVIGIGSLLGGLALVVTSIPTMIRRGGTLNTAAPSSALVTSGVYRFTRNPMYLALVLGYLGVACLTAMLWPILLLPLPIIYSQWVILREERYLARAFSVEFAAYRARVRRWL